MIEQANQRLQFEIALARAPQVGHHARYVVQVGVLAVAVAEAGEDAEHLDLPLRAHPLVVAVEVVEVGVNRQAGLARHFPVADDEIELVLLVPRDVRVAVERDEVVGDRAVDGVLKVDDAGVGRVGTVDDHQVARVVVAVHEDLRLGEVVGEQRFEDVA